MADDWGDVPVADIKAGDRVRYFSGDEFVVARVDAPFLGRDDMVCLVEHTPDRWHAYPAPLSVELPVQRSPG